MTSYYALDNPSALHDALKAHFSKEYSGSEFEKYFSLFYSAYALPNIVLPFFGGYFVDRFGYRWMNMLFGVFLILGHSVFAYGIQERSMAIALTGRVLYGFGGENIIVGLSALLDDWFGGSSEFAMVMGINLSLGRLGSVLNNVGSRAWYHSVGIDFAIWFGVILLTFALVCGFIFIAIDIYVEGQIREVRIQRGEDPDAKVDVQEIKLTEAWYFKFTFWLLVMSCIVIYGCIIPFNNVAGALIIEKFICGGKCCPPNDLKCAAQKSAESRASFVMGIPFIITAVCSPFMGAIVGRWGGNAVLILGSATVLLMVHLTFALSSSWTVLIVFLVFMGLAYTVYAAALWPAVPSTVQKHQIGTAYGLMTSLQNVGLAIFPLCVGAIRAEAGEYSSVEIFFTCLAGLGIGIAVWLLVHDQSEGGILNMAAEEREVKRRELEAQLKGERAAAGGTSEDVEAPEDNSAFDPDGQSRPLMTTGRSSGDSEDEAEESPSSDAGTSSVTRRK